MGNKKNIDRLFQEKFKDFHETPNNHVWKKIEAELENPYKSKKIIPFWVKLSSIAAVIAVLINIGVLELGNLYNTSTNNLIQQKKSTKTENTPQDNAVVNIKNPKSETLLKIKKDTKLDLELIKNKKTNAIKDLNKRKLSIGLATVKNDEIEKQKKSNKLIKVKYTVATSLKSEQKNSENFESQKNINLKPTPNPYSLVSADVNKNNIPTTESIKTQNIKSNILKIDNQKNINLKSAPNPYSLASADVNKNNIPTTESIKTQNIKSNILKIDNQKNINLKPTTNPYSLASADVNKNNIPTTESIKTQNIKSNILKIDNQKNINLKPTTNPYSLASADVNKNNIPTTESIKTQNIKSNILKIDNQKNIDLDIVNTSNTPELITHKTTKDTLQKNNVLNEEIAVVEEKNKILEQAQDQKKDSNNELINRWSISSNIAPVYYNTLSKGSPIDNQFANNRKKGQINTSYGINANYAINNKISIRTGIHKLELGYHTQDVAVSETGSGGGNSQNQLKGLNAAPGVNLNISSANSFAISQISTGYSNLFDSSLIQQIGYLEIPLEIGYQVSNKKMKINMIAGLSTFILNKNEVYSETNDIKTYLGSGNNLNNTSFSTNIGIGLNYNLGKKVNFNLEPTFKYQLNSFNKEAGGFRPYIIGIYTGLSYKF